MTNVLIVTRTASYVSTQVESVAEAVQWAAERLSRAEQGDGFCGGVHSDSPVYISEDGADAWKTTAGSCRANAKMTARRAAR